MIIGAGAIGAACAFELASTGRSVLVIDPNDRPGEGWRASAGLLAPQIDARGDSALLELAIAGREYYRDRAPAFLDHTGIDIDLYDGGILQLARGGPDEDRLRAAVGWQRQHGHRVEWLDPAEVKAEFPWAGSNDGALWAPRDGSVNPIRLVEAFRARAAGCGARFHQATVTGLVLESGRVAAVRTSEGTHSGGDFVVAAGAWSGRLENLPRPISVEPVRGQMLATRWPEKVPRAIVYSSGGYVLERYGEALLGATSEHAGFNADVTAGGERQILETATSLMPAIAAQPIDRRWSGLRPGTPDGLPIVGMEPTVPNLWYSTGHGRNGILLAGITAVALGHLFSREATFEGIDAMRPDRFWSW